MLSPLQVVVEVPSTDTVNPTLLPASVPFHPRHLSQLHTSAKAVVAKPGATPRAEELLLPRVIVPLFLRPTPAPIAEHTRKSLECSFTNSVGYVTGPLAARPLPPPGTTCHATPYGPPRPHPLELVGSPPPRGYAPTIGGHPPAAPPEGYQLRRARAFDAARRQQERAPWRVAKDAAAAEQAAAHAAASATYSLTVTELEALGLPNTDVKGGADPYVVFHHGDSELVRTEDLKDAIKGRHIDVVRWPNSYTCHVSSLQSSRLAISVTVYDRESGAGGDATSTLLGRGMFEIELVPNARKLEQQLSFLLTDVPKGAAASINLTLSMTHAWTPPSYVSRDEVAQLVLSSLEASRGRVSDLFGRWDVDGSGTLACGEFRRAISAFAPKHAVLDDEAVDDLFAYLDLDASGALEYAEVHGRLRRYKPESGTKRLEREQRQLERRCRSAEAEAAAAAAAEAQAAEAAVAGQPPTRLANKSAAAPATAEIIAALRAERKASAERRMQSRILVQDEQRLQQAEHEGRRVAAALSARAAGMPVPEGMTLTLRGVEGAEGATIGLENLQIHYAKKEDLAIVDGMAVQMAKHAAAAAKASSGGVKGEGGGSGSGSGRRDGSGSPRRSSSPGGGGDSSLPSTHLSRPKSAGATTAAHRAAGAEALRERQLERQLEQQLEQQQALLAPRRSIERSQDELFEAFVAFGVGAPKNPRAAATASTAASTAVTTEAEPGRDGLVPMLVRGTPYSSAEESKRMRTLTHAADKAGGLLGRSLSREAGAPVWPRLEASLSPRLQRGTTFSLTVTELEALGLPNTDVKGGADPYVVFHHGDSELVRTEDLKDAIKGRHIDVVRWPNSYTCHVSSLQSSRLAISVTVYDRESGAGGDATSTLLGRGMFEIELVPNARKLEQQLSFLLTDVPKGAGAPFSSSVAYYPLRWRRAAASINLTLSMTHLEPPPSLSPPALRRGGTRGHGPLSLREIDPAAAEGCIFLGADAHSEEGMPGDGATRQPAEGWDAATKSQSPGGASRAVASLTRRLTHTGSRRVGLASPKAGGVVRV